MFKKDLATLPSKLLNTKFTILKQKKDEILFSTNDVLRNDRNSTGAGQDS